MSNYFNTATVPIRLKTDRNVVYLLGVGFIRIPVGIHFVRNRGQLMVQVVVGGSRNFICPTDTTGHGWQKAIHIAACMKARHDRLMGRRKLREVESSSKKRPLGIAGVYASSNEIDFSATYQEEKEERTSLYDAAAFRLGHLAYYNQKWSMRPNEVLRTLW